MIDFFKKYYWFWIISKIIVIIILLISTISILGFERLKTDEILINTLGLIEAFLLLITLAEDFSSNSKFKILKIITGIIMTVFGIGLIIILLTVSKGSQSEFYILGYPFGLWMILIGIFDILRIKKTTANIV